MLTKTNIEYFVNPDGTRGYSWNFYTGCSHDKSVCPVADKCWARGMSHRFSRSFEPTLHPEKLLDPLSLKKPARIGVCFTGDLFGDWVDPNVPVHIEQKDGILNMTSLSYYVMQLLDHCPQHQFFFLTKAPQNYRKWGKFPDNAWCGMTICNNSQRLLSQEFARLEARQKWISFEPLMERIDITSEGLSLAGISFVVIGGFSGGKNPPKIEWVKEIVEACDKAGVKVWLKDNLKPLFETKRGKGYIEFTNDVTRNIDLFYPAYDPETRYYRQELPSNQNIPI